MTSRTLPPPLFDLDAAAYVEREPNPRQKRDETLPPPLFEPEAHGVALTPYGRHHGLGPGAFGSPCCDLALYGSLESSGSRVWIYHVCAATSEHTVHKCDRCDVTWTTA